jgi:hypothetical protein
MMKKYAKVAIVLCAAGGLAGSALGANTQDQEVPRGAAIVQKWNQWLVRQMESLRQQSWDGMADELQSMPLSDQIAMRQLLEATQSDLRRGPKTEKDSQDLEADVNQPQQWVELMLGKLTSDGPTARSDKPTSFLAMINSAMATYNAKTRLYSEEMISTIVQGVSTLSLVDQRRAVDFLDQVRKPDSSIIAECSSERPQPRPWMLGHSLPEAYDPDLATFYLLKVGLSTGWIDPVLERVKEKIETSKEEK